jgi:hypothetical protein
MHGWRWPTAVAWTKGGCTLVDASQDEEALQKSSRNSTVRLGWSPGKACACPSALVNLRSLLTKDPVFLLLRVTVSVTFPGGAVQYLVICV